eukprot:TRINITY_DN14272_c0_g1_i1.p1 TRINITY_DN14272_c0_g1~~TRINITY_DN14272_c0_g1_i1.p1  ORF type:complete len:173 (-),score=10.09 TRINITY_DN14272_c0_g1_i1:46-564(-)
MRGWFTCQNVSLLRQFIRYLMLEQMFIQASEEQKKLPSYKYVQKELQDWHTREQKYESPQEAFTRMKQQSDGDKQQKCQGNTDQNLVEYNQKNLATIQAQQSQKNQKSNIQQINGLQLQKFKDSGINMRQNFDGESLQAQEASQVQFIPTNQKEQEQPQFLFKNQRSKQKQQ